jgi:TrmH family RNA methyltransferase
MEKIKPITNPKNNFIRFIRSLKKKKTSEEKEKFLLEGIHSINEALKSNIEIPYYIYSLDLFKVKGGKELYDELKKRDSELVLVGEAVFNKLCETQNPQGIIAVPTRLRWDEEKIFLKKRAFVIVLTGLQDPGNLGTIVRVSDALGLDGLIVSEDTVDHYNPKTVRSTQGAIFRVPVFKTENIREYLEKLRQKGFCIIATTLGQNTKSYEKVDYTDFDKIALITGNESNGIPEDICELADVRIKIPILGEIESLNAGVATGVSAYEIMRQKDWRI